MSEMSAVGYLATRYAGVGILAIEGPPVYIPAIAGRIALWSGTWSGGSILKAILNQFISTRAQFWGAFAVIAAAGLLIRNRNDKPTVRGTKRQAFANTRSPFAGITMAADV
jgi:hypothetical protein